MIASRLAGILVISQSTYVVLMHSSALRLQIAPGNFGSKHPLHVGVYRAWIPGSRRVRPAKSPRARARGVHARWTSDGRTEPRRRGNELWPGPPPSSLHYVALPPLRTCGTRHGEGQFTRSSCGQARDSLIQALRGSHVPLTFASALHGPAAMGSRGFCCREHRITLIDV